MNIVSIETCQSTSSVSLSINDQIVQTIIDAAPHKQAENLLSNLKQLLENNKLTISDIDQIYCSVGPGSFTGIRIGLSTAVGIKLAKHIPVHAITSFQTLLGALPQTENIKQIKVLINAYRNQYYVQDFNNNLEEIGQPYIVDATAYKTEENIFYVSNFKLEAKHNFFVDKITADMQLRFVSLKQNFSSKPLKPLYIREPDAKKSN